MSTRQRGRLATKSAEDREARLQQLADEGPTGLCVRCCRDKHIPKMYSSANNMDPGPLPPQLQVGTCIHANSSSMTGIYEVLVAYIIFFCVNDDFIVSL